MSPGIHFTAQELGDDSPVEASGFSFKCLQDELKSLSACHPLFPLSFLHPRNVCWGLSVPGTTLELGLTAAAGQSVSSHSETGPYNVVTPGKQS